MRTSDYVSVTLSLLTHCFLSEIQKAFLISNTFSGFSKPCSVCTKWKTVKPGDYFCTQFPNSTVPAEKVCRMATTVGKVCVEDGVTSSYNTKTTCTNAILIKQPRVSATCDKIASDFDMDLRALLELNENPNLCAQLYRTHDICVKGVHDCEHRYYKDRFYRCNTTCLVPHYVKHHSETCESIAEQHKVTTEQLHWNNVDLDCTNFLVGDTICIWKEGQNKVDNTEKHCSAYTFHDERTCEDLASRYLMSFDDFLDYNRNLMCDNVAQTSSMCVGEGTFHNYCADYVITSDVLYSCDYLKRNFFNNDEARMLNMNPMLRCNAMRAGLLVCIRESSGSVTSLVEEVKKHSSAVNNAYFTFSNNMTTPNIRKVHIALFREMTRALVATRVKSAYFADSYLRENLDKMTEDIKRDEACDYFKSSTTFSKLPHIAKCMCDEGQPLISCGALLFEEMEILQTHKRHHDFKDKAVYDTPACYIGSSHKNRSKGGCAVPGCKIDFSVFSLHIDSKMCWPPVTTKVENMPSSCIGSIDCFSKGANEVTVRMCTADPLMKFAFGGKTCVPLKGFHSPLLGVLRLHTVTLSNFFKLEARLNVKLSDVNHHTFWYHDKCLHPKESCEDFCVWRGQPYGKIFGFVSASLDFGNLKIPIYDYSVTFPYDDCYGNKALVTFENQRTSWSQMTIRCWSNDNDDEYFMEEETIEYMENRNIAFKVNDDTIVTCVLRDGKVDDIAIDVYGGYTGPRGRRYHHKFTATPNLITYKKKDENNKNGYIHQEVAVWN